VKVVCSPGKRAIPDLPVRLDLYDTMEAKQISRAVLRKVLLNWVVFSVHSDVITRWLRSLNTNRTRGVKIEVMKKTAGQNNVYPQVLVCGGNNSSQEEPFMVVHTNGAPGLQDTPFLKR